VSCPGESARSLAPTERWGNVKYDRERICLHCPRALSERSETTFTLADETRAVFSAIGPWDYIVPRLLWGDAAAGWWMQSQFPIPYPSSSTLSTVRSPLGKKTSDVLFRSWISIRRISINGQQKAVNQTKQTYRQNRSPGFSAFFRDGGIVPAGGRHSLDRETSNGVRGWRRYVTPLRSRHESRISRIAKVLKINLKSYKIEKAIYMNVYCFINCRKYQS